ncbi:MAG: hypothetical protein R3E44_05305 [Paracoccaceae bacterium]
MRLTAPRKGFNLMTMFSMKPKFNLPAFLAESAPRDVRKPRFSRSAPQMKKQKRDGSVADATGKNSPTPSEDTGK